MIPFMIAAVGSFTIPGIVVGLAFVLVLWVGIWLGWDFQAREINRISDEAEQRADAIHKSYKKDIDDLVERHRQALRARHEISLRDGIERGRNDLLASIASVVPEFRADDEEDEEDE